MTGHLRAVRIPLCKPSDPGTGYRLKMKRIVPRCLCAVLTVMLALPVLSTGVLGWSCKTHAFIAREAGLADPQAACFPDLSKKENDTLLGPYHWHNAAPHAVVTPGYIDRYGITEGPYVKAGAPESGTIVIRVPDPAGVLYWKIVDLYRHMKNSAGWEREYYLLSLAHYVGDLSQPLHNFPYGNLPAADGLVYREAGRWAKNAHMDFDKALDSSLPLDENSRASLAAMALPLKITSEHDLRKEISRIANESLALANRCHAGKRVITQKEALRQVSMSISLLKALVRGPRAG